MGLRELVEQEVASLQHRAALCDQRAITYVAVECVRIERAQADELRVQANALRLLLRRAALTETRVTYGGEG